MRIDPRYFRERKDCVVCGSPHREILFSAPMDQGTVRSFIASHFEQQGVIDWELLAGTDFELVQCRNCRLIYQVAEPTDAMMGVIYTRMIGHDFLARFERSKLSVDQFNVVAGEIAHLFRMVDKPPSEIRFLDYGMGHGRFARVARAMGATVYATEIGHEKARIAAELGIHIIPEKAIDDERFDIIHTEQVFEHLTAPGETFRRLAAVTDGVMKVAVPVVGPIAKVLRKKGMATESPFARGNRRPHDDIYAAIQPLEHLNIFPRAAIDYLARANNMQVVSRTRGGAAAVDISSPTRLLGSMKELGRVTARAIVRRDRGYNLLRPI